MAWRVRARRRPPVAGGGLGWRCGGRRVYMQCGVKRRRRRGARALLRPQRASWCRGERQAVLRHTQADAVQKMNRAVPAVLPCWDQGARGPQPDEGAFHVHASEAIQKGGGEIEATYGA